MQLHNEGCSSVSERRPAATVLSDALRSGIVY